jgi:hypothetical protein
VEFTDDVPVLLARNGLAIPLEGCGDLLLIMARLYCSLVASN